MKKMKCTSCNGQMTIDENKEYATCNYCGTKYKLNEDINININMDEDVKEVLNKGFSHVGKFKNMMFLPIIIFVVIMIVSIFSFSIFRFNILSDNEEFTTDTTIEMPDEFNIEAFNNPFEIYSGNQDVFFIENMLNKVIANNQKNKDKLIRVIYNETDTTDADEIINIENSLTQSSYSIIFDYDDDGYINKVTIK